jgi:acetyl esterase/lipase
MVRVVVAAFFGIVLGAACSAAQAPGQPDVKLNVAYGPDPAQRLDLCVPVWAAPVGGRPSVIMIHGGYWEFGDKSAYTEACKGAAAEGIVAATIEYRLANGDPRHRWPAQAVDAQLAVRWMRSHAAEFGIDPAHICLLGDSAGAQIALFIAAAGHTVPGDDAGELPGVSSAVACVVDNFGPTDISSDTMWPPDQQLFGSDGKTRPTDQERAASPLFLVNAGMPPVMIAHGRDDKSVHIDQSTQLLAALKKDHVTARMTVFNGGHEFEGLTPQQVGGIIQTELDFIKNPRAP